MTDLTLVSFFDGDRSGKLRWLLEELGLPFTEERVRFEDTRKPAYIAQSPLGVVPLLRIDGRTLRESTAIGHHLIETHGPHLGAPVGSPSRVDYLTWISTFSENLEQKLVECAVSKGGLLPPAVFEFNAPLMRKRLGQIAPLLPTEGFLLGEFGFADIVAAYSIRLGVQTGLLERTAVDPWLSRLIERPAAQRANFFKGL